MSLLEQHVYTPTSSTHTNSPNKIIMISYPL